MAKILCMMLLSLCALHARADTAALADAGLAELYRAALQNDPVFAAARATYAAGMESGNIGLSGLLPTVEGSLSSASVEQKSVFNGLATERNLNTRSGSISINQPLFDLGKFKDYSIGKVQNAYTEAVFAEERQSLMLRVSQAYFDFLLAQDNHDLAIAEKKALQAQAEQARRLFEGGVATITDMEEGKARAEVAQAQELVAANEMEIRRKRLEKIVGSLPANLRRSGVYAFEPVLPDPNDLESWKAAAKTQNLKVVSAGMNLDLSTLQAEKAGARHYPTVQLTASYQHALEPSLIADKTDTGRIGIDMVVPFYQGGRVNAEGRRAHQLREKAANELESEVRESEISATEAFLGVVGGLSRIRALEQAVKSSEITRKGMEIGQRNGMRTNTDVLAAQQRLYSAKRDLQRERYTYLISRIRLKASVGGLQESELAFLDALVASSREMAAAPVSKSGKASLAAVAR